MALKVVSRLYKATAFIFLSQKNPINGCGPGQDIGQAAMAGSGSE
jgi:hypothetical protein